MTNTATEVVIVGGGISGVAMALALGRQGRRVQLIEQSEDIAPIGYGVQIGPNVLPMLDQLGVGEACRRAAYLPPEIELYDAYTAQRLARLPVATHSEEVTMPSAKLGTLNAPLSTSEGACLLVSCIPSR